MGQSTDANLYYGIQFDEDFPPPGKEEDLDWEEFYAMRMGLPPIEAPYGNETKEMYSKYWELKRKLVENSVCKIGMHCSCDYPMYYVCIGKSETRASRGYPKVIKNLEVEPNWDNTLREFCGLMGLKYEQPQWWLSSMWC